MVRHPSGIQRRLRSLYGLKKGGGGNVGGGGGQSEGSLSLGEQRKR